MSKSKEEYHETCESEHMEAGFARGKRGLHEAWKGDQVKTGLVHPTMACCGQVKTGLVHSMMVCCGAWRTEYHAGAVLGE